jgi:hypothetical protein
MKLYQRTLEDFRQSYVGYAALVIIGQSCLGSAAAMYTLQNGTSFFQMVQLAFIVITCMLVNVSVLSQQTPKFVFNFTIFSALLSMLIIALNVLVI